MLKSELYHFRAHFHYVFFDVAGGHMPTSVWRSLSDVHFHLELHYPFALVKVARFCLVTMVKTAWHSDNMDKVKVIQSRNNFFKRSLLFSTTTIMHNSPGSFFEDGGGFSYVQQLAWPIDGLSSVRSLPWARKSRRGPVGRECRWRRAQSRERPKITRYTFCGTLFGGHS